MWSTLFTIAAIANIGLSEDIGFLDRGNDEITSEQQDGAMEKVNLRDCLAAIASATSTFIWSYGRYETMGRISKLVSPTYRQNGI